VGGLCDERVLLTLVSPLATAVEASFILSDALTIIWRVPCRTLSPVLKLLLIFADDHSTTECQSRYPGKLCFPWASIVGSVTVLDNLCHRWTVVAHREEISSPDTLVESQVVNSIIDGPTRERCKHRIATLCRTEVRKCRTLQTGLRHYVARRFGPQKNSRKFFPGG
jgi:hypothetical protein